MNKEILNNDLKTVEESFVPMYDNKESSGLAIRVVKDKEIIYCRSFGWRDVENNIPMTTDTLFDIGSVSKSFTTTALAFLVEEGKFSWDQKIQEFFPKLRFKDEVVTSRATLIDILSHRTGLPRHDFTWYLDNELTYDEILARLPHLDFAFDFRTKYNYNNLMYNIGAKIVEDTSGKSYNENLEKITSVLEMKDTFHDHDIALNTGRLAKPYKVKDEKLCLIDYFIDDKNAGAGEIKTTVLDLANYLQFHLGKGTFKDKQILSASNLIETHSPKIITNASSFSSFAPEILISSIPTYGMGWGIENYHGKTIIHHGGAIDGFSAFLSFIPEENLGIACLANDNFVNYPFGISIDIFDTLLGLERINWFNQGRKQILAMRISRNKSKEIRQRHINNEDKPHLSLDSYIGDYKHLGYPDFTIEKEKENIVFKSNKFTFPLVHMYHNTFLLKMEDLGLEEPLIFEVDKNGEIDKFKLQLETMVPPLEFIRKPDKQLKDPNLLSKFCGSFKYMDRNMTINKRSNDQLEVLVPGLPTRTLEPLRNYRFKTKEDKSLSFQFVKDESGNYNVIKLSFGGGVAELPRI